MSKHDDALPEMAREAWRLLDAATESHAIDPREEFSSIAEAFGVGEEALSAAMGLVLPEELQAMREGRPAANASASGRGA